MVLQLVLFESASGYALFERIESEVIGELTDEVQRSFNDYGRFSQMVRLKAFLPFTSAENALENINYISEGLVHDHLYNFLETNVPDGGKRKSSVEIGLGLGADKLAASLQERFPHLTVLRNSQTISELCRGIRHHFTKFVDQLTPEDLQKAQLGLAHSYSRCKVKFNINKVDNMIIQSIALLDRLDKDVNNFAMRIREWYSWHFPELIRIVPDNYKYACLVKFIKSKSSLSKESITDLAEIIAEPDDEKARKIVEAAKSSMGSDLSPVDMINVVEFASRVVRLSEYRRNLYHYLTKKMFDVAPNLTTLIGEVVGARLISHAGSLINLAKCPASTLQILGAEKALFRALKTRGKTPKFGLIFNSSFIGRATAKNKGRISRYLANKCSIASRIDAFSENVSDELINCTFGEKMKQQVEGRLAFYDSGKPLRKNIDVMQEAIEENANLVRSANQEAEDHDNKEEKKEKLKKKKRKSLEKDNDMEVDEEKDEGGEEKQKKKKKKSKKQRKETPQQRVKRMKHPRRKNPKKLHQLKMMMTRVRMNHQSPRRKNPKKLHRLRIRQI